MLTLGTQGQPDFTQPIDLMMDCHRRIERFLGVLVQVSRLYADRPLDEEGRRALETSLHYFKHAAPRHTQDEEDSLFPRLRAMDDPQVRASLETLDRLEADHRTADLAHEIIDQIGRRWLEHGRLEPGELQHFTVLLTELSETYAHHIQLEDEELFVLASRLLSDDALVTVGEEMKTRRQEAPAPPDNRHREQRNTL